MDQETIFRRLGEQFKARFGHGLVTEWSPFVGSFGAFSSSRADGEPLTLEQSCFIDGYMAAISDGQYK